MKGMIQKVGLAWALLYSPNVVAEEPKEPEYSFSKAWQFGERPDASGFELGLSGKDRDVWTDLSLYTGIDESNNNLLQFGGVLEKTLYTLSLWDGGGKRELACEVEARAGLGARMILRHGKEHKELKVAGFNVGVDVPYLSAGLEVLAQARLVAKVAMADFFYGVRYDTERLDHSVGVGVRF